MVNTQHINTGRSLSLLGRLGLDSVADRAWFLRRFRVDLLDDECVAPVSKAYADALFPYAIAGFPGSPNLATARGGCLRFGRLREALQGKYGLPRAADPIYQMYVARRPGAGFWAGALKTRRRRQMYQFWGDDMAIASSYASRLGYSAGGIPRRVKLSISLVFVPREWLGARPEKVRCCLVRLARRTFPISEQRAIGD